MASSSEHVLPLRGRTLLLMKRFKRNTIHRFNKFEDALRRGHPGSFSHVRLEGREWGNVSVEAIAGLPTTCEMRELIRWEELERNSRENNWGALAYWAVGDGLA